MPVQICVLVQNLGNDYLVYERTYGLRVSFMDGQLHRQQVLPIRVALISESLYQWKVHEQRLGGLLGIPS